MELILIIFLVLFLLIFLPENKENNKQPYNSIPDDPLKDTFMRSVKSRRDYYNDIYLKSEAWQRKRYVVLKRDNWRCVYCGARATEVHHTKYAKINIGKEPIEWLVSVCRPCHDSKHG